MFFQACRSRIGAEKENKDLGVEFEIEKEKGSDLSGGQNDGTGHPDARGDMPHEDEKNNEPGDKRQDDGIDQSDAGGYMPLKDKDEKVIQQPNVASGRTEAQGEIENKIENSSSEFKIDLPPIEGVPHCDDCVVMFASMSGKCFNFVCQTRGSYSFRMSGVDLTKSRKSKISRGNHTYENTYD